MKARRDPFRERAAEPLSSPRIAAVMQDRAAVEQRPHDDLRIAERTQIVFGGLLVPSSDVVARRAIGATEPGGERDVVARARRFERVTNALPDLEAARVEAVGTHVVTAFACDAAEQLIGVRFALQIVD